MKKKKISVQRFFEIHIGLKEIGEDYPQLKKKTISLKRQLSDLIEELWEFDGVLYHELFLDEENE